MLILYFMVNRTILKHRLLSVRLRKNQGLLYYFYSMEELGFNFNKMRGGA